MRALARARARPHTRRRRCRFRDYEITRYRENVLSRHTASSITITFTSMYNFALNDANAVEQHVLHCVRIVKREITTYARCNRDSGADSGVDTAVIGGILPRSRYECKIRYKSGCDTKVHYKSTDIRRNARGSFSKVTGCVRGRRGIWSFYFV